MLGQFYSITFTWNSTHSFWTTGSFQCLVILLVISSQADYLWPHWWCHLISICETKMTQPLPPLQDTSSNSIATKAMVAFGQSSATYIFKAPPPLPQVESLFFWLLPANLTDWVQACWNHGFCFFNAPVCQPWCMWGEMCDVPNCVSFGF